MIVFIFLLLLSNIKILISTNIPIDCVFKTPFNNAIYNLSEISVANGGYQISSDKIKYLFNICGIVDLCPFNNSQSCQINSNDNSDEFTNFQTGNYNYGTFEMTDEINDPLTLKYRTSISLKDKDYQFNNSINQCSNRVSIFKFKCIQESSYSNFYKLYATTPPIENKSICSFTYNIESPHSCISKGIYFPTIIENNQQKQQQNEIIEFDSGSEIKIFYSFGNEIIDENFEISFYLKSKSNLKYFKFGNENLKQIYNPNSRTITFKLTIPKSLNSLINLSNDREGYLISVNTTNKTLNDDDDDDDDDVIINEKNIIKKVLFRIPKPIIETITQVDLYSSSGISKVTISGNHFNIDLNSNNGSSSSSGGGDIKVILLNQNCPNVKLLSDKKLTCDLNVNYIRNSYLSSTITYIRIGNVTSDSLNNLFPFLPSWKKCPSKSWFNNNNNNYQINGNNDCSGNGNCDSSLNCICNKGYTSYDCSIKLESESTTTTTTTTTNIIKPETNDFNSFKLTLNKNNGYIISVSHIRILNSLGFQSLTIPITSLSNKNQIKNENGFEFSGTNDDNIFSKFSIKSNYIYNQTTTTTTMTNSFYDYFGTNLPISNNSAIVSLEINNLIQNSISTTVAGGDGNDMIEFLFQIKSIDSRKEIESEIVDNGYILIREKDESNYLLFTLANKYKFSNSFELTNLVATSTLLENQQKPIINNNTAFISIKIPFKNISNSNSFEIGSSFVLHSNTDSINRNSIINDQDSSKWKYYFIGACGVLGIVILLGSLIFIHQRNKVERTIANINLALRKSSRDVMVINPIQQQQQQQQQNQQQQQQQNNNDDNNNESHERIYLGENPMTSSITLSPDYNYNDIIDNYRTTRNDSSPPQPQQPMPQSPPRYNTVVDNPNNSIPNIEIIPRPRSPSTSVPSTSTTSTRDNIEIERNNNLEITDNPIQPKNEEEEEELNDRYNGMKFNTIKVGEGCKTQ
ncbi:hypothetical protein ACTFIZ_004662 [Dictyostelium cf. discoideum]